MTNTDSMEVIRLVDQFFNYAENGQIGEAAGMLYEITMKQMVKNHNR